MSKVYGYNEELDEQAEQDKRILLPLVLADANDIRRALAIGDGVLPELPKGKVGDSDDCVLARALSNGWSAYIDGEQSVISHPYEGKTQEDILKSVDALEQLGFIDVSWRGPENCSCGDPDCQADTSSDWAINVPHTWIMEQFIGAFDKGQFPELILDA